MDRFEPTIIVGLFVSCLLFIIAVLGFNIPPEVILSKELYWTSIACNLLLCSIKGLDGGGILISFMFGPFMTIVMILCFIQANYLTKIKEGCYEIIDTIAN